LFRLALALGKTVTEIEQQMPCRELGEWYAFNSLEPLGEARADLRAALIAFACAAPWSKSAKLTDFLLDFDRKENQELSPEQLRAYLISLGGRPNA
jgi:hypothetical protein